MAEINPYQAPRAAVDDVVAAAGALATEPKTVDAGRAIAWVAQGWALFRRSPLIWIVVSIISLVILGTLSVVPFLGQLAGPLLWVLFAGGLMLGCRALDRGEELTVGHLFAGFQTHLSPLLVIGALYLAAAFGVGMLLWLLGVGTVFTAVQGGAGAAPAVGGMMLFLLLAGLLLVPVAMAVWFAPALATLHDVAPVEAMKASFRGCLRNTLPFLVYGVIVLILAFLASLPFLLGWLVLVPVLAGSVYASYQDIFLQ